MVVSGVWMGKYIEQGIGWRMEWEGLTGCRWGRGSPGKMWCLRVDLKYAACPFPQRLRPTLKSNPEFTAGLIQAGRKLRFDSAVCVSLLPSSFLPSVRRDVGLSREQSAPAFLFLCLEPFGHS